MSHLARFVAICLATGVVVLGCASQKIPSQGQVMRDAQACFDNVTCQRTTAWETPISDNHPQTLLQLESKGLVKLRIVSIERDSYERDLAIAKVVPMAEDEAVWFFAFGLTYRKTPSAWRLQN